MKPWGSHAGTTCSTQEGIEYRGPSWHPQAYKAGSSMQGIAPCECMCLETCLDLYHHHPEISTIFNGPVNGSTKMGQRLMGELSMKEGPGEKSMGQQRAGSAGWACIFCSQGSSRPWLAMCYNTHHASHGPALWNCMQALRYVLPFVRVSLVMVFTTIEQ